MLPLKNAAAMGLGESLLRQPVLAYRLGGTGVVHAVPYCRRVWAFEDRVRPVSVVLLDAATSKVCQDCLPDLLARIDPQLAADYLSLTSMVATRRALAAMLSGDLTRRNLLDLHRHLEVLRQPLGTGHVPPNNLRLVAAVLASLRLRASEPATTLLVRECAARVALSSAISDKVALERSGGWVHAYARGTTTEHPALVACADKLLSAPLMVVVARVEVGSWEQSLARITGPAVESDGFMFALSPAPVAHALVHRLSSPLYHDGPLPGGLAPLERLTSTLGELAALFEPSGAFSDLAVVLDALERL